MNAEQLIAHALAMPHTHEVVTRYADGRERRFTTRSLASAEIHAVGERRKIGRDLISHDTGAIVRVVNVEVRGISAS
jgi:hypothetical protein